MRYKIPLMFWFVIMSIGVLPVSALCGGIEIIDHRTQEQGLFDNTVNAVVPAGDSDVFIASAGGLHILSDYFFLPLFQNIPAVALSQDPGGDLWAATDTGFIYRVTDRDGVWTAARFATDPKKKITAITARHDAVTIGTGSGLYYAGPDGALHTILKDTGVTALASADDGTIIAGARDRSHNRGGLLVIGGAFAGKTGWVNEISDGTVSTLFIDGDRLLIGTDDGRVFLMDSLGVRDVELSENPGRITSILVSDGTTVVASDTGLYISTKDGPFEHVSDSGGAPSHITSVSPGPGRAVWVGTESDGVYLVRVRP